MNKKVSKLNLIFKKIYWRIEWEIDGVKHALDAKMFFDVYIRTPIQLLCWNIDQIIKRL